MELKMISMNKIVKNNLQPRKSFDDEKLKELANSIKEGDLLQPIVVRNNGNNTFEIVAGERRYKAFQILKEKKIPAIVRDIKDDTDALEKSLIENLQRDDLTSVERENAIGSLWDSGRYKTHDFLAKKLGVSQHGVTQIINAKESRKRLSAADNISTRTLTDTVGLSDEPRKKILKAVEEKKIETDKVRDVVRKVKEFPEPEQQLEILEEFEQKEEVSKEIFDDIVKKKKEIIEGKREPEHEIEIETDPDKRMFDSYLDIKNRVYEIYADHITRFRNDKIKRNAIRVLWDIHNYSRKQLVKLDEIKEMEG